MLTDIRWSLAMHWFLAITNACNAIKYVTRFSCDIFGFYVAFIYLQKGIQVLTRQGSGEDFYLSIVVSILVLVVGYICGMIGSSSMFQHYVRVFIKDYGTPLTVVFFTGYVHIGKMAQVQLSVLPTSKALFPTTDRGWFIDFWNIRISDAFIAIPFAILLTILFYFDHNGALPHLPHMVSKMLTISVSSLIAQGTEFPLRKPAGFPATGAVADASVAAHPSSGAYAASTAYPAFASPASKNTALLNALKEEMFALESERINGTLPPEEYAETKAALETVLKRALKRTS